MKRYVIKTNYGYYEDFEYADEQYFRDHGIKKPTPSFKSSTPLGTTLMVGDILPKFTQNIQEAYQGQLYFGQQIETLLRWAFQKNKEIKIELEEV